MERVTILNDLPGATAWKAAVDGALRGLLQGFCGPWTVRLHPTEAWQGGNGWAVEVTRPGHVWTLRVNENDGEPDILARQIAEAVQPARFGPAS